MFILYAFVTCYEPLLQQPFYGIHEQNNRMSFFDSS